MTSSTLVSFRHVRKSWQQVTALQNFSLDIAAGELVALVGSSGCGKSTLLRMLVGLESATQGDICINGEPVTGVGKERGIVFQEPRLFPWLNVLDNVMLGLADEKLSRAAKRQRALEMLERAAQRIRQRAALAALRRHGPAGGYCPRPGGPSADPDARRAFRRAGCPDAPHPAAGTFTDPPARGNHHAAGDARCGRSRRPGRSRRRAFAASGADTGSGKPGAAPSAPAR